MTTKPIRILLAKPGLDGHDRGIKVVAKALRDEGFEVIYTGLHQTAQMIAIAALQEDVDVIGLSIHSGAHIAIIESLQQEMQSLKLKKPIFVGGIIPEDDIKTLLSMGVANVFGPGTPLHQITKTTENLALNAHIKDSKT